MATISWVPVGVDTLSITVDVLTGERAVGEIAGLVSVVGVVLVGLVARVDSGNPIDRLTETVERLAAGEYDVDVTTDRSDEIGRLCEAVDDLAETLYERERRREESEWYRRELYRIASDTEVSGEEKLQQLLKLGRDRLGVEAGFVSSIDVDSDRYRIETAVGSELVEVGAETELSEMYCEQAVDSDGALAIYDASVEGWSDHPAYERLDVRCYLGGKVLVEDELYGTLCFVSEDARETPFTRNERTFVDLMARWVSHMLERREHERKLHLKHRAMETAPIGITMTDPSADDNPLVYVNDAFEALTGYAADEALGHNCRFLQGEQTSDEPVARMREAIESEESTAVELRNYRADGSSFWNRVTISPIRDRNGEVTNFVGFQEDVTDRKEREREREAIIQNTESVIYLKDRDGRYRFINEAGAAVLGRDPDAVIGETDEELFDPESAANVREDDRHVIETGRTLTEERPLSIGGEKRVFLENKYPYRDADGEIVGVMGVSRDITERKNRERELERYREYTNDVLDAIDDVFYILAADGTLQRWNESLATVTGYSHEEIAEMHALDFFGSDERGRIADAIEDVFESGETRIESAFLTNDGTRIPYEFVAVALEDPDGNRVLAGIGRDISERVETARELSRVISNIPGFVYRVQNAPGWPTEFVSDGVRDVTGHDPEDLIRGEVDWDEDIIVDENERLWNETQDALADREPFSLVYPIETLDGERRWVKEQGRGVYDANGSVEALEGVIIDITDQIESERELQRTQGRLERTIERLEESNERLEDFAYAASHDLQEPLRMVSSYLQLIERREDDLSDESREFLAFAVDGADRMRRMIESLLAYSRIETKGEPLEPTDLDAVLADVRDDLRLQLEESDAELTTESLPRVEGDRNQLRQLFQNLLSNAIKYSGEESPRIHIEAERDGDEWLITVSDEGIGIDPDDHARIFSVFERLHGREEVEGVGIGLALCQRIVERHGGEIWVDSQPGRGTAFSFTLPRVSNS